MTLLLSSMRPPPPPDHRCPCKKGSSGYGRGIAHELVNHLRNAREVSNDDLGQDKNTCVTPHVSPFVRPHQPCVVEQTVVIAIIGEQRPAPFSGKQQLSSIRRTFAPLFIGRRDMVSTINKETRQPQGNILVEVERRHLRGAVRGEASVNRFRMLLVVCDCRVHGLP